MKQSQKASQVKETKEMKDRKQPERIEKVLGLNFPVTRMQNFLRNEVGGFDRISKKAAAGLAAVIEFINDKIFDNAIDISAQKAKTENFRVKSDHVVKAIVSDQTLQDIPEKAHFKGNNCEWKIDWLDHWKEQKKEADKMRARRLRKEKKMMEEEEQMPKSNKKKGNKKGNKKKEAEEKDSQ